MTPKRLLRYVLLFLVAFAFIFPVYYMFVAAFSLEDPSASGSLLPDGFLGNLETMFTESEIETNSWPRSILNAILISAGSVIVTLLIGFPAGYVFSRYDFPADKHLFLLLFHYKDGPCRCGVTAIFDHIPRYRVV